MIVLVFSLKSITSRGFKDRGRLDLPILSLAAEIRKFNYTDESIIKEYGVALDAMQVYCSLSREEGKERKTDEMSKVR